MLFGEHVIEIVYPQLRLAIGGSPQKVAAPGAATYIVDIGM
jgi:hypothetical protein